MNEEQKPGIQMQKEDQVLEFEFEDLSGEHSEKSVPGENDEYVIELTDIVEGEETEQEIGTQTIELSEEVGKAVQLPDEPQAALGEEEAVWLSDLEEPLDEVSNPAAETGLDLEADKEFKENAIESLELHLESALEELESGEDLQAEVADEIAAEYAKEAFELEELGAEEQPKASEQSVPEPVEAKIEEVTISAEETAASSGARIDEQRLEEIVTEVVERVVERVARETMAEVAERLISEAIESLKESIKQTI